MPKRKAAPSPKSTDSTSIKEKIYGILLLIVVAIMPLIVRLALVAPPPEFTALFGLEVNVDLFSHYKGWFMGVPVVIIAFYFITDFVTGGYNNINFKQLIKSPPVAAAAIFILMAFISTIFTSYRHTSWHGAADRGEGFLVLLGYFILFFAAKYHVKEAKHAKLIMYGLVFSSIIMGLIGLGQFLNRDFFTTNIGGLLVLGEWDAALLPRFSIAYGTLYNPNTFGKYTAMAAPILLAVALVYDGKLWVRAMFFVGGGLMLVGVLGSGSMGGFIGISAAVFIAIVTFICRRVYQFCKREKDPAAPVEPRRRLAWALGGVVLVAMLVGLYFVPLVNQQLNFVLGRVQLAIQAEPMQTYNYIAGTDSLTVQWDDQDIFTIRLEEMIQPDDTPTAPIDREPLTVYNMYGQQVLPTSTNVHLPSAEDDPRMWHIDYIFDIPDYGRISIRRHFAHIVFREMGMTFEDGRLYALAINGSLIDIREPATAWGFTNRENWGSNRGYIWSRTFPLMPSHAIIGSGPDTYVMVFPQNDILAKARFIENPYTPVDKAHNIFLQTWITTGGISALALMFLFGHYIFTTFMALVRSRIKEGSFLFGLQYGLLVGIGAFCISIMATDSTIGSSGVFYVLFGLGYGVNMLIKRETSSVG